MATGVKQDPTKSREGLLVLACFSMERSRYREMFDYMKSLIEIVTPEEDLSEMEHSFFSSACKLLVDNHLKSWRQLSVKSANVPPNGTLKAAAQAYLEQIADKISKTCAEIVNFIDLRVILSGNGVAPTRMSMESRIFYQNMKANFLGHLAEVKKGLERLNAAKTALDVYNSAMGEALLLPAANPTRLMLALDLAEFHAGTCESIVMAYSVARGAVDMATQASETWGEEGCHETPQILEVLRRKIDTWTAKLTGDATTFKP